jgi:hypothetical protein
LATEIRQVRQAIDIQRISAGATAEVLHEETGLTGNPANPSPRHAVRFVSSGAIWLSQFTAP